MVVVRFFCPRGIEDTFQCIAEVEHCYWHFSEATFNGSLPFPLLLATLYSDRIDLLSL
jgi:hypothetical protein